MRASAIATLIVSVCVAARQAHAQAPEAPAPQPAALAPAARNARASGLGDLRRPRKARGLGGRSGRLDLLVQLFGGYDDDVLAEQSSGAPSSQPRLASAAAGLATGVGAAITYSRPGLLFNRPQGKGDFRAWLDSSLRYYPALDNLTGTYHRFGLRLSAPVSRRVTLYASPRADYSPRYSFELLSGPLTADPESAQPSFVTDAGAGARHRLLGRREQQLPLRRRSAAPRLSSGPDRRSLSTPATRRRNRTSPTSTWRFATPA